MESGTSNTHLEDRVRTLERLSLNTRVTFGNICELLDGLETTKDPNDAETFHCCLNVEDSKMDCRTKALAQRFGIGGPDADDSPEFGLDVCDTRNTATSCRPD